MPIYKAILKYGHKNFIFDIIEYCEPFETIQREQYYLDNFDFYYNVLEKADSLLHEGFKHTSKTREKMIGPHGKNVLGYKHTQDTIKKLIKNQTNKKHSEKALDKMRKQWVERKFKSLPLLKKKKKGRG